jgi:hypothetical protein
MSPQTPLRVLVLRSSEWLRGTGQHSRLCTADGRLCIVGLDARAEGVSVSHLKRASTPAGLVNVAACVPDTFRERWTTVDDPVCSPPADTDPLIAVHTMQINDDPRLDDETRLGLLRPIFDGFGIELDFRRGE